MIRHCYMVLCEKGPFVTLTEARAVEYATKNHGYVIRMFGQDSGPLSVVVDGTIDVEVKEIADVPA